MEEILASIRRIISEDESPAAEAAPAEPDPEDEPAPPPVAAAAPAPAPVVAPPPASAPEPTPAAVEDEVLELTDKVETHGDIDAIVAPAPVVAPAPPPVQAARPVVAPEPLGETLVSAVTASAAASAFGQLSATIAMPPEGLTLADTVRELLKPLLKEWLDNNLADIVQATVAAEVERIARNR
jgi:cell pole-organizing protein PopZ